MYFLRDSQNNFINLYLVLYKKNPFVIIKNASYIILKFFLQNLIVNYPNVPPIHLILQPRTWAPTPVMKSSSLAPGVTSGRQMVPLRAVDQ